MIGNLVGDKCVIDDNEDNNPVVRTWGELPNIKITNPPTKGFAHHHQVLALINGYDPKRGNKIAGHRGYFLKGYGALLNMALVNYGLNFLMARKYEAM